MPKFKVTHNYSSGRAGPWQAGEVVNLDDQELIAWLSRDAPGLLVEVRQVETPPQDRQVKAARNKRTVKK